MSRDDVDAAIGDLDPLDLHSLIIASTRMRDDLASQPLTATGRLWKAVYADLADRAAADRDQRAANRTAFQGIVHPNPFTVLKVERFGDDDGCGVLV